MVSNEWGKTLGLHDLAEKRMLYIMYSWASECPILMLFNTSPSDVKKTLFPCASSMWIVHPPLLFLPIHPSILWRQRGYSWPSLLTSLQLVQAGGEVRGYPGLVGSWEPPNPLGLKTGYPIPNWLTVGCWWYIHFVVVITMYSAQILCLVNDDQKFKADVPSGKMLR